MSTDQVEDRNGKLGEYLEHLQTMALELERSMEAIGQNALVPLEDSVANQQAIANRLSELAAFLREPEGRQQAYAAADDKALITGITAAADRLQSLNRSYAALLRHSSHSVGLMVSLFRSFKGQMQESSGAGLSQPTWSCEV